jgi:nucleoside-diphosphate-sugar epimerase
MSFKPDGNRPNAVVCGAFGYVGRRLSKYLAKKGFDVFMVGRGSYPRIMPGPNRYTLPPCDLLNYAECESVVKNAHWVFNLAADVGGIGHINTHRAAGFASATINTNLLRALVAVNPGVKGYFLASSSCVYGEDPERGFGCLPGASERHASFATASEGYGQAKYFAERTCLAFKQEYGIPVRIGRYHSVYGPGEYRPGKEHFIESIVNKIARAKETGELEIKVWGDGTQRRSPLYIDDCVESTFRLMSSDCSEPVNLAHAMPVSVNGVIEILEALAGVKVGRFHNLESPVGVKNKTAELTKMREILGWEPTVGIHEGLKRVWDIKTFE